MGLIMLITALVRRFKQRWQAETQRAALAERARIARDLHDVLAHSLAAVSVNLQAAEGLLGAGTLPADNPELAKAIECIDRAGTLTREGLAAARRAVLALRDDTASLPDQLSSLAGQYGADGDMVVLGSGRGRVGEDLPARVLHRDQASPGRPRRRR